MLKSWRVCLRCLNYIVLWEFEKKYSKTTSPSIAIHFFARHLRCPLWGIAVSEGFCKSVNILWNDVFFLNPALWYHSDIVGSIQLVDPSSTWNVVPCGASSSGVKPGHEVVAWFFFSERDGGWCLDTKKPHESTGWETPTVWLRIWWQWFWKEHIRNTYTTCILTNLYTYHLLRPYLLLPAYLHTYIKYTYVK